MISFDGIDIPVSIYLIITGFLGIFFALYNFRAISSIKIDTFSSSEHSFRLLTDRDAHIRLIRIYKDIRLGAQSFLFAEYKLCTIFIVIFGAIIFFLTSRIPNEQLIDHQTKVDWQVGGYTALAFVVGAFTSIISGYLGMSVAVYSNARTTISALDPVLPWTRSFNTAFQAGSVMGFSLTGLALLMLYFLAVCFNITFSYKENPKILFECLAGFGLGGSSIALFGRVGGGIYTKAADVGADLAGKVVSGIPEDDPRNPATIADNVGDNVGDVAGMGSDLFGSFAEATCAALIISSQSKQIVSSWTALMFPLAISGTGVCACLLTSFMATHISPVHKERDIEKVLKIQIGLSTFLTSIAIIPVAYLSLGSFQNSDYFDIPSVQSGKFIKSHPFSAILCIWAGLWAGAFIGFVTEYYTSHSYKPTQEVAQSCETGAATNIIYGLALGYKSVIIPSLLLAFVIFFSFTLLDMYGVALSALGMLGTLATCLSIDVYGPVCDNAGGIAEMSGLPEEVREKTDALDAAGNTTAAIGKGFAIGSACLVGIALFGSFVKRSNLSQKDVSILDPKVFSFLLIGAMIPYWFSAMTMKSVGLAANEMVKEVQRQFETIRGLLTGEPGHDPPDHAKCIKISTEASLREMLAPGVLIVSAPIITGILFGNTSVAGLLAGAITGSVQMAISASNTGGAWDNAKKYVEKGCVYVDGIQQPKGSKVHKAAVVGDTVGDPLKDTSGPALNIVMKLMSILAVVFCDFFRTCNNGHGLISYHQNVS